MEELEEEETRMLACECSTGISLVIGGEFEFLLLGPVLLDMISFRKVEQVASPHLLRLLAAIATATATVIATVMTYRNIRQCQNQQDHFATKQQTVAKESDWTH